MNRIEEEVRKGVYSVGYNGVAVVDNTFWIDFSIAEEYGEDAVRETYERCKKEWGDDIKYATALCITLNHKLWKHYEDGDEKLARVYDELWRDCDGYILECEDAGTDEEHYRHFTPEEINYFIKATD